MAVQLKRSALFSSYHPLNYLNNRPRGNFNQSSPWKRLGCYIKQEINKRVKKYETSWERKKRERERERKSGDPNVETTVRETVNNEDGLWPLAFSPNFCLHLYPSKKFRTHLVGWSWYARRLNEFGLHLDYKRMRIDRGSLENIYNNLSGLTAGGTEKKQEKYYLRPHFRSTFSQIIIFLRFFFTSHFWRFLRIPTVFMLHLRWT